jgi:putative SOS response-associated peptidase YedK
MRIPARYNLAPTQSATVILDEAEPTAASFRWGLLPHWAKDLGVGARGINARIETVAEKPMFRAAFKAARRCLIPMAGYYEWRAFPDGKQPFFIHRKDGEMLYAAGLWESRHRLQPEEEPGTFVIITSDSIDAVQNLHERMPVYLGPDQLEEWATAPPDRAMDMLLAAAVQPLTAYPVSRQVNNARNRGGPEFLEPVEVATPTD